jgi:hypothetical protein
LIHRRALLIAALALLLPRMIRAQPMVPALEPAGPMVPHPAASSSARSILLVGRSTWQAAIRSAISAPPASGWINQTANTPNMEGPLSMAADSTGDKLFIGGNNGAVTPAISLDQGATFTPTDLGYAGSSFGLSTSSSDGQIIAYTGDDGMGGFNVVRVTTNGGSSWTGVTTVAASGLLSISAAGSGTKIAVGDAVPGTGAVYISTNSGTSFLVKAAFGTGNWLCVFYSRDGSTVYAAGINTPSIGSLMRSTNDGTTATNVTPGAATADFGSVCCSSDGAYVIASDQDGHIWTSSNSGGAWTDRGMGPGHSHGRIQPTSHW